MATLPKSVLYYGKEEALPEQTALRAGPLSLVYEAGNLRWIRWGDREILRMIYAAVRDRNWDTVPGLLSNLQMQIEADSFRITYDAAHRQGDIDFFWRGTLTGDAQGTITFTMDGEARSTFLRNRIGFCILHPAHLAGAEGVIERVDGTRVNGRLPTWLVESQPVEPFSDMRALTLDVGEGLQVETRFEGDLFEMEDQRNWTDASFKTFSTPLRLPFPVEVPAGTTIRQSVTVSLRGRATPVVGGRDRPLSVAIGDAPIGTLPPIGLGIASHGQALSERERARLEALALSHLRTDVRLFEAGWPDSLRQPLAETRSLGMPLEVGLLLPDSPAAALRPLRRLLDETRPEIVRWLIYPEQERFRQAPPHETLIEQTRLALADYAPGTPFGAGTNADFIFLNRFPPPLDALDFLTFSICPQIHAFDNSSLVETLAAQADVVRSALRLAAGRPVTVSPVTLKLRFNPYATAPAQEPLPGELPPPVDVRQMSLFGACWTLGSLKYLAESGAHSVTYYETTGWRGVMETEQGSPLPERFRSLPGAVFPLYHVFADVGEFAGGQVLPATSSAPLRVDGLALQKDGRARLLLANMRAEPQAVVVPSRSERVRVRFLDETNAEEAMRAPEAYRAQAGEALQATDGNLTLRLLPYALARIDWA